MEDRFGCKSNSKNVVMPKNRNLMKKNMKIMEQLAKPRKLCCSSSKSMILYLCRGLWNCRFLLRGPRDRIRTKKHHKTGSGLAIKRIPCPISINEGRESEWTLRIINAMRKGALNIVKNLLAASKCVEVGNCINWHNWCTLKAKSGLVKVRYIRHQPCFSKLLDQKEENQ